MSNEDDFVLPGDASPHEELVQFNASEEARHSREKFNLTNFISTPRTITALIVVSAVLVWIATYHDNGDVAQNSKRGLLSGAVIFLVFAVCEFPDSIFRRPHPLFWRFVMGVSLLYLLVLVFLLFQSLDSARHILSYIDPKLGVPLPERNYASDCRVYTPEDPVSKFRNIRDAVIDEFFIAHGLGWYAQTLIFRDTRLALFCSALFEFMERTFRHILPNFYECWWDSFILDLLLANNVGILCGHYTLKWLDLKEYNWIGITKPSDNNNESEKVNTDGEKISTSKHENGTKKGNGNETLFGYFLPKSWTRYNWGIFSNWKRFLHYLFLIFMTEFISLSVFALKALLWIPPPHPIVVFRLALICFIVAPALREYYQFVIDPSVKSLGINAWLCLAIAIFEGLIIFKWTRGMTFEPFPKAVKYSWFAAFAVIAVFFFTYFPYRAYLKSKNAKMYDGNKKKEGKVVVIANEEEEEDKDKKKKKKPVNKNKKQKQN